MFDTFRQELLDLFLNSPIGPYLQIPHNFLLDWYQLWHNDDG